MAYRLVYQRYNRFDLKRNIIVNIRLTVPTEEPSLGLNPFNPQPPEVDNLPPLGGFAFLPSTIVAGQFPINLPAAATSPVFGSAMLPRSGVSLLDGPKQTYSPLTWYDAQSELATGGMTLMGSFLWKSSNLDFNDLANATDASLRVPIFHAEGEDWIIMEQGGTTSGIILYVYQGTLYFQCGDGGGFGTAANRAEISTNLPPGSHVIEWSASSNVGNSALYLDGVLVGTQNFTHTELAENNVGGIEKVHTVVATNRAGWVNDGDGNPINSYVVPHVGAHIFNSQLTSNI